MKVLGEVVHEVMGHGVFVLLFGGDIIRVHIAFLWPYEFSYISSNGSFWFGSHTYKETRDPGSGWKAVSCSSAPE